MADISSITFRKADNTETTVSFKDNAARSAISNKVDISQGSANAGKAMVVDSNGQLVAQAINGLPTVTAQDNGKILQVVNGSWQPELIIAANGVRF